MKKYTVGLLLFCCLDGWSKLAAQDDGPAVEMEPQRVNFTKANTLFAVLHELGRAIIDEFEVPILGMDALQQDRR